MMESCFHALKSSIVFKDFGGRAADIVMQSKTMQPPSKRIGKLTIMPTRNNVRLSGLCCAIFCIALTAKAQARGTNQRESRKGARPHGAIRSRSGIPKAFGTYRPHDIQAAESPDAVCRDCLQRFVRPRFHKSICTPKSKTNNRSGTEYQPGSRRAIATNTQIAADIVKTIPMRLSVRPVLNRWLASGSGV